ncbi:MAG: TonB C-terminal domain-containing protein [Bdellovibrionaceae bacterium]|nr:TonB C-terminal domain-containing protein [Pseudobdellovibrionaceae bacterium]
MKKRNVFRIALLISLALHALLTLVVWYQPSFLTVDSFRKEKTEIELVSAEELLKKMKAQESRQGQIVTQDQRVNDEVPQDSKYLSKFNQKVEKETRAELNDRFRNSTGTGGPQAQAPRPGEAQKTHEPTLSANEEKLEQAKTPLEKQRDIYTDANGIAAGKSMKDFKPDFRPKPLPMGQQASGGGEGPSATDDHLKVAKGMQTLLSTREFVYYTYYNRIKDRLRQYWEPKIKEKMERVMRQGRTIASDVDRVTKCVIILDRSGTLVRVQVVGASGLVDLDEAAIEAFRAAAPFPNPPKGIVEKDGFIRIRWDFILEANSRSPRDHETYAALE